jgi:hypothetical protein
MRDNHCAFALPLRIARDVICVPVRGNDVLQILTGGLFDQVAHDIGLLRFFQGIDDGGAIAQVVPTDVIDRDANPYTRPYFFDFVFDKLHIFNLHLSILQNKRLLETEYSLQFVQCKRPRRRVVAFGRNREVTSCRLSCRPWLLQLWSVFWRVLRPWREQLSRRVLSQPGRPLPEQLWRLEL